VQINDANLYAAVNARDVRSAVSNVEALMAALPGGVDLSKARAWACVDQTGTQTILASHNIESITDDGVGSTIFFFATPFKTVPAIFATVSYQSVVAIRNYTAGTEGQFPGRTAFEAMVDGTSHTAVDADYLWVVCFGELENE